MIASLALPAGVCFAAEKVSSEAILKALTPKRPLTRNPSRRTRSPGKRIRRTSFVT